MVSTCGCVTVDSKALACGNLVSNNNVRKLLDLFSFCDILSSP